MKNFYEKTNHSLFYMIPLGRCLSLKSGLEIDFALHATTEMEKLKN